MIALCTGMTHVPRKLHELPEGGPQHTGLLVSVCPHRDQSNMHANERKKERKKSLTREHVKDIGSTVGIQSYPRIIYLGVS